jgi:MtN3 and saliva related transmembrane protein
MDFNITQVTGITASVFTGISLLPQLVKIIKEKKAEDISLLTIAILFTGLSLWTVYGVLKKDYIIIISNAFSLVVNVLIVIFTLKYKED